MSVIITPPITPNKVWGFDKRNSKEKLHHPVLSLLGKLFGVTILTSVAPENSWGISCVILEGLMVILRAACL